MPRVLVVDDEPQLARLLVINLKARKYDVATSGGSWKRTPRTRAT